MKENCVSHSVEQALVATALRSGEASAVDVGFVALHGTGTPLGDPIEIGALAQCLTDTRGEGAAPISLSSVKASHQSH